MPRLTIVEFDGTQHHLDAEAGRSVMQVATAADVPGILAECGGACVCATCHCYVDEAWLDRVTPPGDIERELVCFTPDPRENSRLSCQLRMTAECDGLVVRLPRTQI